MKRSLFAGAAALALLAGVALGGCSSAATPTTPATPTPAAATSTAAPAAQLTISAAQSLKKPLTQLAKTYEAQHPGTTLTFNYGGSGQLAQQIQQGAPVDLFLSASAKDPTALQAKGLVEPGSYLPFLSNTLVVAVPKGNPAGVRDLQGFADAGVKKWVTGNPASVPHGAYAQQSFEKLGIWDAVKPKAVFSENVAQTLTYIEQGSVDAGVLFQSEIGSSTAAQVVYTVPDDLHKPIVYVGVVIKGTKNAEAAKAFEAFVAGPDAVKVFEAYGFKALPSIAGK